MSGLSRSHSHSKPRLLSPGAYVVERSLFSSASQSSMSCVQCLTEPPPSSSGGSASKGLRYESMEPRQGTKDRETRHFFLSIPKLPYLSSFLPPKAATKLCLSSGFLQSNQLLARSSVPLDLSNRVDPLGWERLGSLRLPAWSHMFYSHLPHCVVITHWHICFPI